jgi:hypothetical protein
MSQNQLAPILAPADIDLQGIHRPSGRRFQKLAAIGW